MNKEQIMDKSPFSLPRKEKDDFFQQELESLTNFHRTHCEAYDRICRGLGEDSPWIPVSIFKDLELRSITDEEVARQVTSSGTTGQKVSRIFLDAETSDLQRRALCSITGDFIGGKRLPMLIIDSPDVLKDRRKFSARGAGILGFSMMASKRFYALDENMNPDWESIQAFQEKAKGGPSFAFGFTYMIWAYFYQAVKDAGRTLDLDGCYLIHGGGWKKLQNQKVSDEEFKRGLKEVLGISQVSDYYGMAEQTGSIFMECPCGHLHASIYSDITALDPADFSECETGRPGLLALRSWLPRSYPGHYLLTEDWGRILGTDDCPCGRKGRYFEITGRIPKAEIRGCSDTFEGASSKALQSEDMEGIDVLAGSWPPEEKTRPCFDDAVMDFLSEMSKLFMKDPAYRAFPDIYALGFWCRRAHLDQIRKRFEADHGTGRKGRGLALHIAPSNMPAMFAYSWIASLLAGDSSVVRLSSKDAEISEMILRGIRQIMSMPEFESIGRENAFVRFPRGHRALEEISQKACARLIWGGDATVRSVSEVPKADGCTDIGFPDKYSIAVFDTDHIAALTDDDLKMQAHLFYRDTYGADQNACSSPRTVFWITGGSDAETVKKRWWEALLEEASRYELQPWMATEKYRLLCVNFAENPGLGTARRYGNLLYTVPLGTCGQDGKAPLPEGKMGLFYEADLDDIEKLYPYLTEKIQTLVCLGIDPEELMRGIREAGCPGADRAVVPGEALDFDTIWDRKDLIQMLSGSEK